MHTNTDVRFMAILHCNTVHVSASSNSSFFVFEAMDGGLLYCLYYTLHKKQRNLSLYE